MFPKLLCVALLSRFALGDELLSALEGEHKGNRLSLCMGWGQPARCEAALWQPQWVVARASCLAGRDVMPVVVLRDAAGLTCNDMSTGVEIQAGRVVRALFVHPQYRAGAGAESRSDYDLALLILDRPYYHIDNLPNATTVHHLLQDFELWMKRTYKQYSKTLETTKAQKQNIEQNGIRLFVTAVILPTVSFMAFFLFVTFYTGTPVKVPYTNLYNEKSLTESPIGV